MALFLLQPTKIMELKGYYTSYCYMGWTGKRYIPFASESDYYEYMFAK